MSGTSLMLLVNCRSNQMRRTEVLTMSTLWWGQRKAREKTSVPKAGHGNMSICAHWMCILYSYRAVLSRSGRERCSRSTVSTKSAYTNQQRQNTSVYIWRSAKNKDLFCKWVIMSFTSHRYYNTFTESYLNHSLDFPFLRILNLQLAFFLNKFKFA